jgi:TRAP-type C4-dicarboxylate transport system permease large subunit
MSLIYQQNGSQGAKTIEFLVRDGSDNGKVSLFSSLAGSNVAINVWGGDAFYPYSVSGVSSVLDTNTNVAVIQGAGRFQIVIPASKPLAIYASLKASVQLISGI